MRGRNQSEKIAVRGKEVFVGIGVHKESWQVTIRTMVEYPLPNLYCCPAGWEGCQSKEKPVLMMPERPWGTTPAKQT